jgi:hypothetical protein
MSIASADVVQSFTRLDSRTIRLSSFGLRVRGIVNHEELSHRQRVSYGSDDIREFRVANFGSGSGAYSHAHWLLWLWARSQA